MNTICTKINMATQMRKIKMAQLYNPSGLPYLVKPHVNKSPLKKKNTQGPLIFKEQYNKGDYNSEAQR